MHPQWSNKNINAPSFAMSMDHHTKDQNKTDDSYIYYIYWDELDDENVSSNGESVLQVQETEQNLSHSHLQ